mgnify:CR=1 FL=1
MPRVSISISVLNQLEPLRNTLQSIVNQSFKDWECFVVDDGSSVSHEGIVRSFKDDRIKFHRFPINKGVPHGGLYGYKNTTGEFVTALGCDEVIYEHKLRDQVEFFDKNPEIDIIWGVPGNGPMGPVPSWEQYFTGAHNRSKELWIKNFLHREGVPIGGGSCLYRRKVFDSVGYPEENLTAFSDFEFFLRVFKKHKFQVLPFRWMNEIKIPGHVQVSVRTEKNAAKLDKEWEYVNQKHQLLLPPTDGLVTFGMPVYNHSKYIGEAINALLAQTDQNFELIIFDDASTDKLDEALKPFLSNPKITFHRSDKNEGMAVTGNKLLKLAKGEFFVLLSADDTMDPTFTEKCRKSFKADPFLEYVSCQNDFMTEDGKPYTQDHVLKSIPKAVNHTRQEWHDIFYIGNVYFGMGMYRTSTLIEVGGWQPEFGVIADYQMYLKLLPRYNFYVIEEPLTHTRIHGKNQSLISIPDSIKLRRTYYEAQRPFYRPRPKIMIATPFYELKGFSPYIASLDATTKVMTKMGIEYELKTLDGDSYIHRARNSICMDFLADPYMTDLFFIDSDMAWSVNGFMSILFRPEPVIGGTYPVKNKWEMWTSKPEILGEKGNEHFFGINLPDGNQLIKANQLAGGFLRVKRSVLEKFIEYYPYHRYNDTNPIPTLRKEQIEFFSAGVSREPEVQLLKDLEQEISESNGSGVDLSKYKTRFEELRKSRDFIGEDYCFSNRLKAMGCPLFILPNVTITHFGINGWTGNFSEHVSNKKPEAEKPEAPNAAG